MPKVDLGVVHAGERITKNVTLSSQEVANFEVEKVLELPDFIDARILPDDKTVEVSAKPNAKWGKNFGILKVSLRSPDQEQAWIQVDIDVHGDVVPSVNPLNLGAIKNDAIRPAIVQLTSVNAEPFEVGNIRAEKLQAKLTTTDCDGTKKGCVQIEILLDKSQATGRIDGKILVDLPAFHQTLPVEVAGILFDKSAKINVLDQQALENRAGVSGRETIDPQKIDIKEALNHATNNVANVPLPGVGPLLKWQASDEKAVHGYLIFRAISENGQFQKISKDVVRAKGDENSPGSVSSYQYRDNTAEPGKTYWYYIGLVYNDGHKQQLTGPQKVVAK